MNETLSKIMTRRSIRKFKPEQFSQEDLQHIVNAGLYAPSSKNSQAWHLTVVRGQKAIARVTREVKAATERMPDNRYKEPVGKESYTVNYHAPTFIIVSANPTATGMPQADCALALGNMFLAAHSLGIGSCWINQLGLLSDEPGFRAFITDLGVPAGNHIYGCATFGYAEGAHPSPPLRREGTVNYVEK